MKQQHSFLGVTQSSIHSSYHLTSTWEAWGNKKAERYRSVEAKTKNHDIAYHDKTGTGLSHSHQLLSINTTQFEEWILKL